MENERVENPGSEQNVYTPRPAWQVWAARLGVVIVAAGFLLYLIHIATGGAF